MPTPTMNVTMEQLTSKDFWEQNAANVPMDVIIPLADGNVTLPMQIAIFNGMMFTAYLAFNIPIKKDMIFWPDRAVDKDSGKAIYSFTSETVNRCTSQIYNELILKYGVKDHMKALTEIWLIINNVAIFADRNTREYQVGLDALSLARLCVQKPMKDIITRDIDASHGTKFAEKQFEQYTKELMKTLGKDGLLKDNVLMPFMLTKLLKRNQVPQMFMAFGTRSDIDDSMMKHPISSSAFSGLNGVEDFAIEALSAKKAEYFNSSVIKDAQYFARRCRLAASCMPNLHKGSCGSTVTIPMRIDPNRKFNFLGKFVKVDDSTRDLLAKRKWTPQWGEDESVELTADNIDRFVGREIRMWSPFGCKFTDGCCEHCAGYMHQRLEAYIPADIHLGVFMTTKVVSAVTQKILSAKHLIKTSSKEFVLKPQAGKYFTKSGDAIVWQPGVVKGVRNCWVRFESSCFLGPMSDLTRTTLPAGVSFSKLDKIALLNSKGETIDMVEVTDDITFPYFSNYMMEYMRENYKSIKTDGDYIDVPMQKFNFDRAFLKYTAVNDDMVSYVKRVERFVMGTGEKGITTVTDHTSIQSAILDFADVVWSKTDVNIFPIEIMLRGYLVDNNSMKTPVITDPYAPVKFAGMADVISTAALSTKLAFQGVKDFFREPEPTMTGIGDGYGYNDCLYNYAVVK